MSFVAPEAEGHLFDEPTLQRPASGRHGVSPRLLRLPQHPIRMLFGESRSVSWLAILLIVLVGMLLVRPMMRSVLSYHRTDALLTERRGEVASLERRNDILKRRAAYRRTDGFIAERGREYGLVVPGETPYVVRELARPDAVGAYARARVRNVTLDHPAVIVPPDPAAQ